MHRPIPPAAAVLFALALAACASPEAGGSPNVPTAPPRTSSPPTTAVARPTSPPTPPSTSPPDVTIPAELADLDLVIDDGSFDSIASMAAASTVIVAGEVRAVRSLGQPDIGDRTDEYVAAWIAVDETVLGQPIDDVVLGWNAYRATADGARVARYVTNGIAPPEPGDRLLLFLDPVDQAFADVVGGDLTHQLVKLDGILRLTDRTIVGGEAESSIVAELLGRTVDDVRSITRS